MFDNNLYASTFQTMYFQLLIKLLEKYRSQPTSDSPQPVKGSFAEIIQEISERYNIDPNLVQAVVKAESNYDPQAQSPAGAQGLMQLMPTTASSLGVANSFDPAQNIEGGVRYLRTLLDRYQGDVTKALAGYNAGPGAVDEYGGIPPYEETQTYVSRVLDYYNTYSGHTWSA